MQDARTPRTGRTATKVTNIEVAAGAQRGHERAILFADISGSTQLYEQLGDEAAAAAVLSCLAELAGWVAETGGRVIQRVGDELMCLFPSVEAALDAAVEMQRVGLREGAKAGPPLAVRIGCHFGVIVEHGEDIFGDVVNVASRVTAFASEGTVMVTEDVVTHLIQPIRHQLRLVAAVTFKGKRDEVRVYELLWREKTRATIRSSSEIHTASARIRLETPDVVVELASGARRVAVVGRDAECDIVVDAAHVSRRHARIELRGRKFFVVDQSLNGTWVEMAGVGISLLREEAIITGSGQIRIGGETGPAIDFVCL